MYILYIYIKVYKNDYIKSYDKLNFLQKFATTGRGRYQRSPIFWEKNLEFFFRPEKIYMKLVLCSFWFDLFKKK